MSASTPVMDPQPLANPELDQADARLRRIFGAVLLSALFSFASFHPLALGSLAYVALVPVLVVVAGESRQVVLGSAYCFTVLYHVVGLAWIAMTTPEGWLFVSFLEGFYGMALIGVPLWIRKRTGLPLGVALPIVGAGLEFIRGWLFPFIAFPWLLWGSSQYAWDTLIQVADIGSVYIVTALVLGVNGGIADIALLWDARRRASKDRTSADARRMRVFAAIALSPMIAALLYGAARRAHVASAMEDHPGPRLLVVQVDVPQSLKDAGGMTSAQIADANLKKTWLALTLDREPVDAVIWSETMWPFPIRDDRTAAGRLGWDAWLAGYEQREGNDRKAHEARAYASRVRSLTNKLLQIPGRVDGPLLVGAADPGWHDEGEPHNSYYCLVPDPPGQARVESRYDKIQLVPISEYIPFKDSKVMGWAFRFFESFVPKEYGFRVFEPGQGPILMRAGDYQLAPNICFEISFPEQLRLATKAGADVHVCPANDGWFVRGGLGQRAMRTAEVDLARAHAKFRAIENRRAVVRCVNRGVSLVIDPTGEETAVVKRIDGDGNDVEVGVEDYLFVRARTTKLRSFYVRFGSVFPIICVLLGVGLCGCAWRGKTLLAAAGGAPGS